mgnify:CR=1 FL=1
MIENVDHIIIAVEDLESAEENYTKIFGIEPVWRGFHNELGTSNVLFNFENTYFELLAAKGEGLGAELVKNMIKEKGEVLIGIVFGTKNINQCSSRLKEMGYSISEISDGEGIDGKTNQIRNWNMEFVQGDISVSYTHLTLPTNREV